MWALIKACDAFQLFFRINSYNNFSVLEIYLLSSRVPGLYGNTSLGVLHGYKLELLSCLSELFRIILVYSYQFIPLVPKSF